MLVLYNTACKGVWRREIMNVYISISQYLDTSFAIKVIEFKRYMSVSILPEHQFTIWLFGFGYCHNKTFRF